MTQAMRVSRWVILAAVVAFWGSNAAAELRVGTVDVQRVRKESPGFQAALKEIDAMVADFEKRRDQKRDELTALSQQLQDATDRNLPASIDRLRRAMSDKSSAFQQFMTETFGDKGIIETQSSEKLAPLYSNLADAAKAVAKARSLDLILDLEQINPLFASDSLDVTDDVLAELAKMR